MKEKTSELFSQYIIDGVAMDETPFDALYDCLDGNGSVDVPDGPWADIVDEQLDKSPQLTQYREDAAREYIAAISKVPPKPKSTDLRYTAFRSIASLDALLLDAIFRAGHFTLGDILVMARWDWNFSPAGSHAAFWESTTAIGHYLFDLGVRLDRYFVEKNSRACTLEFILRNKISSRRNCPAVQGGDPSDWIIYVPFQCTRPLLGGSALSRIAGHGGGAMPDITDADYFLDCFEVIREAVEDGVITAGIPVGYGGLALAAEKFRGRKGLSIDIQGIMSFAGETSQTGILFAEVPGVIIQIQDSDYDYFDSQMLLQDIVYFPLGHPLSLAGSSLQITRENRGSVSGILSSLLSHTSEGED